MRWLVPTLAAAVTAVAGPVVAQTYGYGYGQSYGYGQPYGGQDFDYRRCYRNESVSACRSRLQRQAERRWDDDRYGRSRGGYGYDDRYGSYNRYNYGRYDYGQGYGGYYGQGYGGYDQGYYGGYGRDSGASVALTILGIALGAQILGSLDDRDYWDRNRHDDSYNDWCRRQHSSYDWNSGTYRHQDGSRRYCRRW